MTGIFDFIKSGYSDAVNAGVNELADLQAKARSLQMAAQSMLWRKNELAKMAPTFKKDPKAYDIFTQHMQRGDMLQSTITSVMQKVDSVLSAAKAAGMNLQGLGAVPLVAAAVVAGVIGTIATVAYAIHAYEQNTAALMDKASQYSGAITAGRMTPQQAIDLENASQGKGASDTKKYFLAGGVCILIAMFVWKFKK